jgi:aryl-alcohol dehydrogenase-like predicted oxidoreductase
VDLPTELPTKQLGTTDMRITRVGFGAWALGGGGWSGGWGAADDDESVGAIRYAVEQGVNWIDTAPVYGFGRSEEVVGQALKGIPEADRPFVFTKCGLVWNPDDPEAGPTNVMDKDSVRRELDASLRRLGVDQIDLYQVHWPPTDGTPLEDYWGTMVELKQQGKVRAIGMSNHDVPQLDRAQAVGQVDSLQPPFSLIHRGIAADLLPWAQENDSGVIVYSPMQSGLLTGRMTRERVEQLPEDDWRKANPDFTENLDANLAVVDVIRRVAERHSVPIPTVAVAWTLSWPGVTGAIVGARRPDQVDGWLPAAGFGLSDEELAELATAVDDAGAGEGPTLPG